MLPLAPAAPVPPPTGGRGRERRSRWWIAAIVAILLVAATIGAALVPVPYIALRPGSARPVADQITVRDAESFAPDEPVAFTTVRVGGVSLLEAFAGWLDDDVDVLPEDRVRGDRTPEENRRYNAQLMDTSKLTAIAVALQHLGEDVTITTSGTVVREIAPESPAAEVLERDDVITAVDGEAVDEIDEVGELLQSGGPGARHTLTIERPAGSETLLDVEVTTVAAEDDPDRAIIGIAPEDRIVDFEFPIDVTIDAGTVGGPSAGLAFTLAVLDLLTPGELTGGRRVAVTGTMSLDGTVGPVGGGVQKAVSVREDGFDVFLVPSAEEDEVRAAVGDDLDVIAVDTLDEALEALAALGGNADSLALPAA
jgi:PDZ domain-containing protein